MVEVIGCSETAVPHFQNHLPENLQVSSHYEALWKGWARCPYIRDYSEDVCSSGAFETSVTCNLYDAESQDTVICIIYH